MHQFQLLAWNWSNWLELELELVGIDLELTGIDLELTGINQN
jgi:hypothetical protein